MGIITSISTAVGGVVGCEAGIAIGRCTEREALLAAEGGRPMPYGKGCTKIGAVTGTVVGGLYGVCGGTVLNAAVTHSGAFDNQNYQ